VPEDIGAPAASELRTGSARKAHADGVGDSTRGSKQLPPNRKLQRWQAERAVIMVQTRRHSRCRERRTLAGGGVALLRTCQTACAINGDS
jgi:hypothetical protein